MIRSQEIRPQCPVLLVIEPFNHTCSLPSLPQIFRGSFGLARPKNKTVNPYALPPAREGVRIPQQLKPHPLLPPSAAATLA